MDLGNVLDLNSPLLNAHQSEATLLDAWLWCYSDLKEPTNRGNFAEFIVYLALKSDPTIAGHYATRKDWDVVDFTYGRGIVSAAFNTHEYFCSSTQYGWGIEVKSSSSSNSLVKFDLEARQGCWFRDEGCEPINIYRRWSDFYILAHFKDDKAFTVNIMDLENWEFFVLPTWQVKQDSIRLSSLRKRYKAVGFSNLKRVLDRHINHLLFLPMLEFYKWTNDLSKRKCFEPDSEAVKHLWCERAAAKKTNRKPADLR